MELEMLKELGFTEAAEKVQKKLDLKKKLTIAYEYYRVVTPAIIERFQTQLRTKTEKRDGYVTTYEKLVFIPIAKYGEVPPVEVLAEIKTAQNRGCFDSYEVAKIETIEVRPDPIVFGLINGCEEKFYIAQWDNDVRIEDILNENEG